MKVGMLARTEDRGLGTLTREWYRNMQPDRTLIVVPQHDISTHFEWYGQHGEMFTSALTADAELDEKTVRVFLDGLDVVYSAETFYDWRVIGWARELGVRTVLHSMPEYLRHGPHDDPPHPDTWWLPTSWRKAEVEARLGRDVRVVPVPIPLDRFEPHPHDFTPQLPLTWVHPAGARARMDRNGSVTFLRALGHLREQHRIIFRSQSEFQYPKVGPKVDLAMRTDGVTDYWRLYDDADAVVIPRKYGGLCLPALEALGASCALMMTDCPPQSDEWPIIGLDGEYDGQTHEAYGNTVTLAQVQPKTVAASMDACAREPEMIARARAESRVFAENNSWSAHEHLIREELARVL